MRQAILAIFLSLWVTAFVGAQERQLRIFQLNNRPAEATLEIVRDLLSPDGKVTAETRLNKLIVRDNPEVLAKVEKLLQEIDQPAPQVRIFVDMNGVRPVRGSSAVVGVSGNNRRVRVGGNVQAVEGQSSAHTRSNLLVMSGERGVITVGEEIVAVQPYWGFLNNLGLVPPGVVFQTVSTGFAVQPQVVGDVVRLTIEPWIGFRTAEGRGAITVQEAATTIALKSGDSTTISSTRSSNQVTTQAYGLIFGSGQLQSSTSASIIVRPEIVPDWSSPD